MHTQTASPATGHELVAGLAPALDAMAPAFPSLWDVQAVAAAVQRRIGHDDTAGRWSVDPHQWTDSAVAFELEVSPGVLRLRSRGLHAQPDLLAPARDPELVLWSDVPDVQEAPEGRRGVITEWSSRSRANMAATIGSLDLSDWNADGRRALMFITLTLPGEWQQVAPTGAAFKRIMDNFRRAWDRRLGKLMGVWKLEFQERGAPHLHILATAPARIGGRLAYKWIAQQWVAAVNHPDHEQRRLQLSAHDFSNEDHPTGCVEIVDQWADHKKLAVYFNKHSAKTRDAKEYQHNVPAQWRRPGAGPGRFWGVWGLKRATCRVPVSRVTAAKVLRIMRHVAEARNADQQLRVLRHAGIPVSRARLSRLRYPRRLAGMWILTNDGLQLALDIARSLSLERT